MEAPNEPGSTSPQKGNTGAFPGVLIAIVVLIIIGWVGWKLMQPPPTPPVPADTMPAMAKPEPAPAQADTGLATNTKDPICGMNPQSSALRVEAQFSDKSRLAFDSLACYYRYVAKNPTPAVANERVVDYDTYHSAQRGLLDFAKAIWLIDLKSPVAGAMPPGAVAFATKEAADKAIPELGGKISDTVGLKAYIQDYLKKNGLL